jgi:hypothetical protein
LESLAALSTMMAARLRPEHAEAVLGVVEGDPLDEASENFLSR